MNSTAGGTSHVSHGLVVACDPNDLRALLTTRPATWLTAFARIAAAQADHGGVLSDAEIAAHAAKRLVVTELGDPSKRNGMMAVPIRWETSGYGALFDSLEGLLVVGDAPGGRASLIFVGEYRCAPLSDQLAGRRAARDAIQSLLGNLRSALEERARALRD